MRVTKDDLTRETADKQAVSAKTSSSSDVSAFVERVQALSHLRNKAEAKGRLIFSLDATLSRQPTWDMACHLQAEMFDVVDHQGGLEVQLNYFRGFGECRSSKWVGDGAKLRGFMGRIRCQGGRTQIKKVFANARREHKRQAIDALVFIGDAMEENVDVLCSKAGELGMLGVPLFIFQEGRDATVERAFREFARLTKGAYARFDQSSAEELASLLRSVAVYATGGLKALEASGERLLLEQMSGR